MNEIVLIDDNRLNLTILQDILSDDYRIYTAPNGYIGLDLIHEIMPALVLVDLIMPGIDGYEVIRRLKQDDSVRDIPVIIITSIKDAQSEEKGFKLGAVDYILKPFMPNIIKARVKTHTDLFIYRRTIENLAKLDGLTGIPNRRTYEQTLETEWKHALTKKRFLTAALLDIDYFKEYNDNYGHLAGDQVLKTIAGRLADAVKSNHGFTARYGGEEFVILLPDTPLVAGQNILEKICFGIEGLAIPHEYTYLQEKTITVSIGGVSFIPTPGYDIDYYLQTMDDMLYRAKGLGRNQVVFYKDI